MATLIIALLARDCECVSVGGWKVRAVCKKKIFEMVSGF